MTIIDKIVAAVTPPETEEARRQARNTALSAATRGDWLAMVLEHHENIEAAFAAVKDATTPAEQVAAQKRLATVLNGHSVAEEVVLYPALADAGEKGHATMAYTEQSAAKIQMALLEKLEPLSNDFLEKLEHIRGAVAHHMYEEEASWFLDLKQNLTLAEQERITTRYIEEFSRYVGANVKIAGVRQEFEAASMA